VSHALSMSRMSLATLCAWWARPDAERVSRPSGAAARLGTRVHLIAQCAVEGREVPAPTEDFGGEDAAMAAPLLRWIDDHRDAIIACEVGLAYDAEADKAREIPARVSGEAYAHTADELPGTLDLVMRHEDGGLVVVDIKTGKRGDYSQQLHAQAVAASRRWGSELVRPALLWARKRAPVLEALDPLDGDELDVHAGRIRRLLKTIPTAAPNPGDHCWRCDARGSCPAYQTEAAQ
jgi:CRISPR/Cas system-associated exonuclease Cas4 (RecB family)